MSDSANLPEIASTVDVRPWFVSLCFVNITMSASLFIFLLMEDSASSSFLALSSTALVYSKLSAVVMAFIFVLSMASVLSVWVRHRKLFMGSVIGILVVSVLLILVITWASYLNAGHWDVEFAVKFAQLPQQNASCPSLNNGGCCGWTLSCPSTCQNANHTCSVAVANEISDYVTRVIPISFIVAAFACVVVCSGVFGKPWDTVHEPVNK